MQDRDELAIEAQICRGPWREPERQALRCHYRVSAATVAEHRAIADRFEREARSNPWQDTRNSLARLEHEMVGRHSRRPCGRHSGGLSHARPRATGGRPRRTRRSRGGDDPGGGQGDDGDPEGEPHHLAALSLAPPPRAIWVFGGPAVSRLDELAEKWAREAAERQQPVDDVSELTEAEGQAALDELHRDGDWDDQPWGSS